MPSPKEISDDIPTVEDVSPAEDADIATTNVITSSQIEGASNSAANSSLWSSFISSTLGVFDARPGPKAKDNKGISLAGSVQWTTAMGRAVGSRLQECIRGVRGGNGVLPGSAIWLLGVCYRMGPRSDEEEAKEPTHSDEDFRLDFSSRIWVTYRGGFEVIGDSKLTSDDGWGCMIRSGQMLLAQALVCHRLGRAWRRGEKPYAREYLEIVQSFGDNSTCPFSIHNFITAGSPYGLVAGCWLGPYALCHAIGALLREGDGHSTLNSEGSRLAVYVVSGDAEGARGGAPILYIDDVADLPPVLILVPLVLGLERVNPRYLPSLRATFTFPQSLGIVGGRPHKSLYFVGVQDDQALYLDPHRLQQVVTISGDDSSDTSSYHCSDIWRMPLDEIDPSLALGFYCKNREEFDDFCQRASELASQSNGAPMFTVAKGVARSGQVGDAYPREEELTGGEVELEKLNLGNDGQGEEDWQFL